jgi:hypothetical protein
MNLNINVVVQSGIVKWPALRYGSDGRPEYRFVLYRETQNADGLTFPLSIPCCAVSSTAERLASELDEGDFIVVTHGELCYRRRDTKEGEKSRLEILVWGVQVGEVAHAEVSAGDRLAPDATANPEPEPTMAPPTKVRKPRYPKWRPESSN